MANAPQNERQLWEMLECYRPGQDDLDDPALAGLAAALKGSSDLADAAGQMARLDAKLAAAFHEVAVPDGVAERIMAKLAQAPTEAEASDVPNLDSAVAMPSTAPRDMSRRWWIVTAVSACAAACLLVMVLPELKRLQSYSEAQVLDETVAFFGSEEPVAGRMDDPPADLPISRDVLRLRGIRWRYVEGLLGREGVAYDLPAAQGARATLYVVAARSRGLPVSAPQRPTFTTGDCSVAAWQEGSLLYVLVVHGGQRAYQGCLDPRGGPVAFLWPRVRLLG